MGTRAQTVAMAAPRAALGVLLLCLVSAAAVRADDRPRVAAVRATAPLRIDGSLDEADWQRATPIRDFQLIQVREGQAPSESTEVRVLVDETRIVFGIRCENRTPGKIRASVSPRDAITDDDFIAVHLDTYHDHHRAYVFGVNPFGVQIDGILTGGDVDLQWDGIWAAEARRDAQGWTAEIAIPLRILRFPEPSSGVWGLWIRRQITKNDEVCSWPLWKASIAGDIMLQSADLTGLEGLAGGGRIEVQPYVTSTQTAQRFPTLAQTDLGPWIRDEDYQAGVDLKAAPSATLVLNGTVNPDYSQIEADALQFDINQRFPLFYAEKRPFFLEGADYFSTPIDLVYTRRIADPDYGFKATGTIGRMRVGGLVVRDAGGGSLEGIGDGSQEGSSLRGMFEIARATYQIGDQSSLGGLFAAHQADERLFAPAFAGFVPFPSGGANLVYAADWRIRLARPLFLSGQVARSHTHLDTTLFADPFADSTADFGRTDISGRFEGIASDAQLEWNDGIRDLTALHQYYGPGFRAESGFLRRVDVRRSAFIGSVLVRPENSWLRSWEPIVEGDLYHDPDGPLQEWYVSPMIDWKFQKQTHMHTMYERVSERWQGRFFDQNHYILNLDNSLWRALSLGFTSFVGDGIFYAPTAEQSFLGFVESYQGSATWRPSPRVTSEIVVTRNCFSRARGHGLIYDVWQSGAKTTLQFTRRFFMRIYPQYDSGSEHLEADGLLAYVVHPGTVLYVGANSGLDPIARQPQITQSTVFVKASYAWVR